ncbi:hypothetical protein B5P43_32680 [Bacillus sp. SRB_336]|nr:hypothetical protein B5P43_32680 [Bacillus sp. SRB_336]
MDTLRTSPDSRAPSRPGRRSIPTKGSTMSNRTLRSRLCAALLAAPLAAILAACGGSPGDVSVGSSTSSGSSKEVLASKADINRLLKAPTAIPSLPALPSTPPSGKTIVFLNQSNVPIVVTEGQGLKDAAQAVGWNFTSIDYDSSNPASLQQALTSALTHHPAAVGLVGSSPTLYGTSVINAYKAAKTPIIASAVNPVTPGANGTVLGTLDNADLNAKLGGINAKWVISDSGGSGNVLLLHVTGFEPLNAYVKEFKSTMKTCSGCKVSEADATLTDVGAGNVSSIVVSKLRQDPNIRYVVYDEGDWAGGINSAMNAADIHNVKIAGEDPGTVQLGALAARQQNAWAAHSAKLSGYFIMDQALRSVAGVTPQPNAGNVPIQVLTPDNIAGRTDFEDPTNALDQFKKLWKVN